MAIENNYFNQFLTENSPEKTELSEKLNALKESTTILDLIDQKKVELGIKSEEKKREFINQEFEFETGFDGDTLNLLGRLSAGDGNPKGFSLDAFETAKYDENNQLIPYLGSVAPEEGQKRSKKWNLHRAAYAKIHGIPSWMVTQDMLNKAGAE